MDRGPGGVQGGGQRFGGAPDPAGAMLAAVGGEVEGHVGEFAVGKGGRKVCGWLLPYDVPPGRPRVAQPEGTARSRGRAGYSWVWRRLRVRAGRMTLAGTGGHG